MRRRGYSWLTPQQDEEIGRLRDQGLSYEAIANELGLKWNRPSLSRGAVIRAAKRATKWKTSKDARMTMRYSKTLSKRESLEIRKGIDLGWEKLFQDRGEG